MIIFLTHNFSLFLFLQPARMNPFGRAEKKQNAAAAPDAIQVSAMALSVPAAPAEAEKNVNGDFVLWPKLMNNPVSLGKNTAGFMAPKIIKTDIIRPILFLPESRSLLQIQDLHFCTSHPVLRNKVWYPADIRIEVSILRRCTEKYLDHYLNPCN